MSLMGKQWMFALVTAILLASSIGFVAASSYVSSPPVPGPSVSITTTITGFLDCLTSLGPEAVNGSLAVSVFTSASPRVGSSVCFHVKVHNLGTGEQTLPPVVTITIIGAVLKQLYMPIPAHAYIIQPGKTWDGAITWDTTTTAGLTSGLYHVQVNVGYITASADLALSS